MSGVKQKAALEALMYADDRLNEARLTYEVAVKRCVGLGISYSKIARTVGKSEAAIRLFMKRRQP